MLQNFKVGDLVEGIISGVVDFGAFVRIESGGLSKNNEAKIDGDKLMGNDEELKENGESKEENLAKNQNSTTEEKEKEIIEGLIHISEIDWQLIEDPRQILKTGQKIQAKIIGIEGERLSLSLKALKKDPWLEIDQKYQKGQKVIGSVTKFNPFGAFVQLDKDIHGLVHISEFGSEQSMNQTLEIGKQYEFKILSIEPRVHKMALGIIKEESQTDKTEKAE